MKRHWYYRQQLCLCLLLLLCVVEKYECKRGSVFTASRGSSGSRLGALHKNDDIFSGTKRGIFNSNKGVHGSSSGAYNLNSYNQMSRNGVRKNDNAVSSGWSSNSEGSKSRSRGLFTKSNIGSFIAGAGTGYLTHKAGRALIESANIPMMWNNRPYYWDSSYYKSNKYGSHMCHVHVDPNDEDLGKVYFQDGTRPKELVWSCNYDEYCCGYECCN